MEPKPAADVCIEVSFECGNKVGGIYTVLSSKAKYMKKYYGKNYYTIGFYNPKSYYKYFEEERVPDEIKKIFQNLEKMGIKCYWGKWITADDVRLILIDPHEFMDKTDSGMKNVHFIKKKHWEEFKIDSLRMGYDYDEPLAWSHTTGILIKKLINTKEFRNKKIVVHFHEWLSGAGLLYLKSENIPVATVFTIHATRVGRAKSSAGENLLEEVSKKLKKKNVMKDDEAHSYHLEGQHLIEKTCANKADVFTTVSDIVAEEAKYILGKEPDVITINGLDLSKAPSLRTLIMLHEKYRDRIEEFLKAYFTPYYPVKLKNNLVFFISGRYEFYNKGIDLFIEALSLLNERLKRKKVKKNVFAFILIPSNVKRPREDLLECLVQYEKIEELVEDELKSVKDDIINMILNGETINFSKVLDENFIMKAKILSRFFTRLRSDKAPLCAFELNYENDMITNHLKKFGLLNEKDDKVKVIFYPTYLSVTDGLLGMDYNEFVIGSSMGFFPSRYEPWGYTPFETAVLRTLSLTTDVAGFGLHLSKITKNKEDLSTRVLRMKDRKRDEVIDDLAKIMEWCVLLGREKRPLEKIKTRELVESFDWKYQIFNYIQAHNLALKKIKKLKSKTKK